MYRLSFLALPLLFMTLSPAMAQNTNSEDAREEALAAMEACRAIGADSVRLICMDAAAELLDSLDDTEASPAPVPAPPVSGELTEQQLADERAALVAEREALEAERRELDLARAERDALETERRALEVATAEREALDAERRELEVARAEVEASQQEINDPNARRRRFFGAGDIPDELAVTITKITRNRRNIHKFHTTEGEILVQSDVSQRLTPPSALPASAIIKRATLGSKWLIFDERPDRRLKISLPR